MRLACAIYVSTEGFGDQRSAARLVQAIGEALAPRLASGVIAGYHATAVVREADYEFENIDRDLVVAVTGGRLPAVYVNVTYDVDDPRQRQADLVDLTTAFPLRRAFSREPR